MASKTTTFEITMPEVMRHIKMNGEFLESIREIAERRITLEAAREEQITVTDEEVQDGADDLRILKGLQKRADFEAWLETNRLSLNEFEAYVRDNVTIAKFKQYLAGIADRDKYISLNKHVTMLLEEAAYADWLRARTDSLSPELPEGGNNADQS